MSSHFDDLQVDIRRFGKYEAIEVVFRGKGLDPKREYWTMIPVEDDIYRFTIGKKTVRCRHIKHKQNDGS